MYYIDLTVLRIACYTMKKFGYLTILLFLVGCQSNSIQRPCDSYELTNQINKQLITDLKILSSNEAQGRRTATQGSVFSYQYLAKRFEEIGLKKVASSYLVPFSHPDLDSKLGRNVVGEIKGRSNSKKYIVITAHYDHLGRRGGNIYFGADDNASGVAMMLALAQHLIQFPPKYSVIFVATDAEEKGLLGSNAFIQSSLILLSAIKFNINLDMLGRANRLFYLTNKSRTEFFHQRIANIKQTCLVHKQFHRSLLTGRMIDYNKASDHWSFAKQGIDFLFVGGGLHADYHRVGDSASKISATKFSNRVAVITQLFTLVESNIK